MGDRKPPWCVHIVVSVLGQITVAVTDHSQPKLFGISAVRVIDGLCLHHFLIWTATVLNSMS